MGAAGGGLGAPAEDGRPEAQRLRAPLLQPRPPHADDSAPGRGAGVAELRIAGTRAPEPGRHAPLFDPLRAGASSAASSVLWRTAGRVVFSFFAPPVDSSYRLCSISQVSHRRHRLLN